MDFFETFDMALTKASGTGQFYIDCFLFSSDVMFVVQVSRWGGREVLVKFFQSELDDAISKQIKKFLDSHQTPFVVRFLNIQQETLPNGFVQDDNDVLYGFIDADIRCDSSTADSTKCCIIRSDQTLKEIKTNLELPRFMGFDSNELDSVRDGLDSDDAHVYDDDIIFSSIWKKNRTFVFSRA
jgi:hypothetical protein